MQTLILALVTLKGLSIPSSNLCSTPRPDSGLRYCNMDFWIASCAISAFATVWTAALTSQHFPLSYRRCRKWMGDGISAGPS